MFLRLPCLALSEVEGVSGDFLQRAINSAWTRSTAVPAGTQYISRAVQSGVRCKEVTKRPNSYDRQFRGSIPILGRIGYFSSPPLPFFLPLPIAASYNRSAGHGIRIPAHPAPSVRENSVFGIVSWRQR